MNYLFRDEMYQPYAPVIEDRKRYEYARYEANGVNILDNGWREKFEKLAQQKLTQLKQQNPKWMPYLVLRGTPFASEQ